MAERDASMTIRHGMALLAACTLTFAAPFAAAQELRLGLAAPLSGPMALLGEQLKAGAWEAVRGRIDAQLYVADDRCSAEAGERAARQFVEYKIAIVTGFLCTEAVEAALPILKEAGIPVISPGVRTNSLTDNVNKTRYPFFRLGPRASHEAEAAARILGQRWREALFAIVDDGTIYGRELAEAVRFAAEQSGMKPVFVDTFRPQLDNQIGLVGRLRKAGATHVFVGGDRDDIAIIARDAAELGYDLTIAGGEALRAAGRIPLAEGVLMIGLPDWADVADDAVVARIRAAGVEPEGYVLPSHAAVEIAAAALREAASAGGALAALRQTRFETAIGPIEFDDKGDLTQNPYRLFRYDGVAFQKVE